MTSAQPAGAFSDFFCNLSNLLLLVKVERKTSFTKGNIYVLRTNLSAMQ
jgi:hypothetical protein